MATPKTTLFVGDLAIFCTEGEIRHAFAPFGEILEIKIMKSEETNRNLSYGFIKFASALAAKEAMVKLDGKILCGRPLRIRWASYKNKLGTKESKVDGLDNSPVHVSFISYQVSHLVTEESLRVLFNRFGLVSDVSIKKSMIDQEMGRQSGYGFVYFSIHNDGVRAAVEAAQALTDTTIDEVNYKCSLAHNLMKFLNVDAAPPALAVPPAPVPAPAPVLVPPTAELEALSLNEAQPKASAPPMRAVQHQSQGQHQGHHGGHQQQHSYQQAQAQAQAHAQQQYQHHQQQHQQQQAYQQQQQQHMQQLQQHLEFHPPVLSMPQPMAMPMLSMDGQLMMQQAAQQQMAPPLSPISMAMALPMGYGPQGSPVSYNTFVPTLPAGYMPMPPMPMAPMQLASSPAGGYRSYSSPSTNARTQTAMRMMMPPGTFMQPTGQMSPLSCTSSDSMKEEQLSYLNFLCSPVSSAVPNYFPHASPMSMPPSPFQPPFGNPQESPYIYPLWEHSRFKQPQAQGPAQQVRTNSTQGNGHNNSAGHSPKSPNSNSPRPPGPPPVSMAVPLRARAQRTASSKIRAALVISEAPSARAASPPSPAGVAVTPSVPVAEVVEVQS